MKKTKEQNGITLLALIITIIVLVILAAVTLNTLTNNNGIISNSQYATQEYNKSVEKEAIVKALSESKLKLYIDDTITELSAELLEQQLASSGYNVSVTDGENGNFIITFNNTGDQYEVTPNGRIVGEEISVATENNGNTENAENGDDDDDDETQNNPNEEPELPATIEGQYGNLVDEEHDTINQDLFLFTTQEPSVGLVRHAANGTDGVVSRGDTPSVQQKGTATITGINWNYFKTTNPNDFEIATEYNAPDAKYNLDENGELIPGSTDYTFTVKTVAKKSEIENALRKLIVPYEVTKEVNGVTKTYKVTRIDVDLVYDISFNVPKNSGYQKPILSGGSASSDTTYLIIPNNVTTVGNINLLPRDQILFASNSRVTQLGPRFMLKMNSTSVVSLPSGLKIIGTKAFSSCTGLRSFTIPSGVTSIGNSAFYCCSNLANITIPNSVTSIGKNAFVGCNALTSITIPSGVTSIGNKAFSDCDGLTSITIPSSVTSIGDAIFSGCDGLTTVTIPSGVTSIGEDAFSGCSSLTSITIPSSVTSIGKAAFSVCDGLTTITIPDSVTSIGDSTFYYCDALTSITIPSSVTSIGNSAFYCCDALTSITIPDSVTSIGEDAFSGCDELTSITIPSSVTSIGGGAFSYLSKLKTITYKGTTYKKTQDLINALTTLNENPVVLQSYEKTSGYGNNATTYQVTPFYGLKLEEDT